MMTIVIYSEKGKYCDTELNHIALDITNQWAGYWSCIIKTPTAPAVENMISNT